MGRRIREATVADRPISCWNWSASLPCLQEFVWMTEKTLVPGTAAESLAHLGAGFPADVPVWWLGAYFMKFSWIQQIQHWVSFWEHWVSLCHPCIFISAYLLGCWGSVLPDKACRMSNFMVWPSTIKLKSQSVGRSFKLGGLMECWDMSMLLWYPHHTDCMILAP